ncbi:hypothetical protein SQ03_23335 [Methylobacterium platani JCM 14648]|uniref:Uncharacterized protein n=2 Tax=Methylobacterium platani TaxID=427683 RepID=A0A179SK69_9HYPH|nr:hypothetical protein SQ03_23335 [Methylobacterium platani JCM 14648]OAS27410.1 hypothetical protein A5481_01185 [Methylobacterium platani]
MVGLQRRPSADIIAFRTARRPRADDAPADFPDTDAVRGTILLFTGVRYERLPDPAEPARPASERRCRG